MSTYYNKAQLIAFLDNDMTGPGFGGELEIQKINQLFPDQDVVPADYVSAVFQTLYSPKMAAKEFKIMETAVVGYITE